jgi:asparagine synthase (glutamine-hydrolysing)
MCGLVVTVSFDGEPAEPAELQRLSETIRHRGPDDSGIATYGPVGFGFRRLSILDLTAAGHQPMETPDGRLAIVFNGEIYNYIELRRELEQYGHTFRSTSDTEVLLQAYDRWGPECVSRFNGMWAFVVYDRQQGRLVASRDRFGVKPLYRWSDGRYLILASEIKAILASSRYRPEANWPVVANFLCRGRLDIATQTFYRGIDQLAAGSVLDVDLRGASHERRFWSLSGPHPEPPADPIAEFRELFEDSVRLRMRSDVPVGVCLSGGIDSNAIISMMARLRDPGVGSPLHAFSYIPREFGEAGFVGESIARTGAVLNELTTTPEELWDLLPRALWHYDEPVHSPTALIGYALMRLARSRGVPVVLNGQGADEVNAGYHLYFKFHWTALLSRGRWGRALAEMSEYSRGQGKNRWSLIASTTSHWLHNEARRLPGAGGFRTAASRDPLRLRHWFSPDLIAALPPRDADEGGETVEEMLERGVSSSPLPLYLRVEDRNSMAHSVEAREPFLDYRLVSLAFSLPAEWKLRGPWNKYLVREAMRDVIAEPVRTRLDKMGFPTSSGQWFAGPWYGPTQDVLGSAALRDSGVCHVGAVRRDLERHRAGEISADAGLFHVAEFATWLEQVPGSAEPAGEPPDDRVVAAGGHA